MGPRANHRGWLVLDSYGDTDGRTCVDVFEDRDGGFGFEFLRADPEDGGRWTAVGAFAGPRYASKAEAVDAACEAVTWLRAVIAEGR